MRVLIIVAAMMACALSAARAESLALLIGNAHYQHSTRLRSPLNDVDAIRRRLEGLGFTIAGEHVLKNADRLTMGRAIKSFAARAREADTALVYFSGHGMELGGDNYVIPIDAELRREDDASLEAIGLEVLTSAAGGAARLSVVVVDACRNNTFPSAAKSGAKGFRPVAARPGQVVAFATAPGTIAYDGDGALSPYTRALDEALERFPKTDVRLLFTSLGPATRAYAGAEQQPFSRFGDMPLDAMPLALAPEPPTGERKPAPEPVAAAPAAPERSRIDFTDFRQMLACKGLYEQEVRDGAGVPDRFLTSRDANTAAAWDFGRWEPEEWEVLTKSPEGISYETILDPGVKLLHFFQEPDGAIVLRTDYELKNDLETRRVRYDMRCEIQPSEKR